MDMGKGQATVGLVLGIVGIVFAFGFFISPWLCVFGLPVAIVGLVLSVVGGKKLKANGQPAGLATAGLIIGIIATVYAAISFFTCGLCTICAASTVNSLENALDDYNDALNDALSNLPNV